MKQSSREMTFPLVGGAASPAPPAQTAAEWRSQVRYRGSEIDLSAIKPRGTLAVVKWMNGYILPLAPQFLLSPLMHYALWLYLTTISPLPNVSTINISILAISISHETWKPTQEKTFKEEKGGGYFIALHIKTKNNDDALAWWHGRRHNKACPHSTLRASNVADVQLREVSGSPTASALCTDHIYMIGPKGTLAQCKKITINPWRASTWQKGSDGSRSKCAH